MGERETRSIEELVTEAYVRNGRKIAGFSTIVFKPKSFQAEPVQQIQESPATPVPEPISQK